MRAWVAPFLCVGWISLGELGVLGRLLFDPRHPDYEFVLLSVAGVLAGTLVTQSWQQRLLGPFAVTQLQAVAPSLLDALKLYFGLMLLCANTLLFAIVWRRTRSTVRCGLHFHLAHNLRQVLFEDFREGRTFIAISVLSAVAVLCALIARKVHARAALLSLFVIASVFCFGYVNETRHYLPLLAFWIAYAGSDSSPA